MTLAELVDHLEQREASMTCTTTLERLRASLPEFTDGEIARFVLSSGIACRASATDDFDYLTAALIVGLEAGRELERRIPISKED